MKKMKGWSARKIRGGGDTSSTPTVTWAATAAAASVPSAGAGAGHGQGGGDAVGGEEEVALGGVELGVKAEGEGGVAGDEGLGLGCASV
jgi:hypothetical protein